MLDRARARMVDVQIAGRGVRDRSVLDAMRRVPREAFVHRALRSSPTRTGRCRSVGARPSRSPMSSH